MSPKGCDSTTGEKVRAATAPKSFEAPNLKARAIGTLWRFSPSDRFDIDEMQAWAPINA